MRGGKREGAGRKPGYAARSAEEARRLFSEKIAAEIEPIADALIAKAKNGDVRATSELFDRAWGRAPQSVDLTSEGKHIAASEINDELETIALKVAEELRKIKTA